MGDFAKFADALISHKLLDAEHTQRLITGKATVPGGPARNAYGFEDDRSPDGWGAVGMAAARPE